MPSDGSRNVSVYFSAREVDDVLEPFEEYCEEIGVSRSEGVKLALEHFVMTNRPLDEAGIYTGWNEGSVDDKYHRRSVIREALEREVEHEAWQ